MANENQTTEKVTKDVQHVDASDLNAPYSERRKSSPHHGSTNRTLIAVIVYLALLLDNILLTVIVPILPDYLAIINNRTLPTTTTTILTPLQQTTALRYASLESIGRTPTTTGGGSDSGNNNNNNTNTSIVGDSNGNGILGAAATAQHISYRNLDGTVAASAINQLQQQEQQQPVQHYPYPPQAYTGSVMTKHPIPGKSMVNFSLIHLANDDNNINNNKQLLAMPLLNEKQHQKHFIANHHKGEGDTASAYNSIDVKTKYPVDNINSNAKINLLNTKHNTLIMDNNDVERNRAKQLASENGSIGILLSVKALIQLIFNPIVGNMSTKYGYRLPIVIGTFCLLMSSLVFAVGETYITLLIARAIQGIGSACIGVCGMSLVAQHYPEEERRSKIMGVILGSIALGVLLGYPFGGILYDLFGKSAPFIILALVIFLNLGLQLVTMDLTVQPEVATSSGGQHEPKWKPLLQNKMILAIVIAIWFSTSTMALLEPCLPIWLLQYLKATKWQLGTVFIPDSLGYFVGTNFFGGIAYKYGQIKVSCLSLLLVGIASIMIPSATTVAQLLLPHFALGLGIGVIDAALVPLLATYVDATLAEEDAEMNDKSVRSMSSYGSVYAIQQTSVSLAYCLAPLIGGELAQAFGFVWLMRIVGVVNVIYGPILILLEYKYDPKNLKGNANEMLLSSSGGTGRGGSKYRQLYNSVDTE